LDEQELSVGAPARYGEHESRHIRNAGIRVSVLLVPFEPPDLEPPPPVTPRTVYFQGFVLGMYDNARWQISKHQFAAGVLLAQVAVEMGTMNAFTSLLVRRDGPVDDAFLRRTLPDVSFMEEATRRLWTELTGGYSVTRPRQPPVWANYHRHVEFRNAIAHGTKWGDSAGRQCVEAAGAFIERLDGQMLQVDEAADDL